MNSIFCEILQEKKMITSFILLGTFAVHELYTETTAMATTRPILRPPDSSHTHTHTHTHSSSPEEHEHPEGRGEVVQPEQVDQHDGGEGDVGGDAAAEDQRQRHVGRVPAEGAAPGQGHDGEAAHQDGRVGQAQGRHPVEVRQPPGHHAEDRVGDADHGDEEVGVGDVDAAGAGAGAGHAGQVDKRGVEAQHAEDVGEADEQEVGVGQQLEVGHLLDGGDGGAPALAFDGGLARDGAGLPASCEFEKKIAIAI